MEENLDNKDYVIEKVRRNPLSFRHLDKKWRGDKDVVLASFENSGGYNLEFATEEMKRDRDVVLAAAKYSGYTLSFASEELRGTPKLKKGDRRDEESPRYPGDRELMLEIAKIKEGRPDGYPLEFMGEELQNDKEIVSEVIKSRGDGSAFRYAGDRLKRDREFIIEMAKISKEVLEYIKGELFYDPKFREEVQEKLGYDWDEIRPAYIEWDIEELENEYYRTDGDYKKAVKNILIGMKNKTSENEDIIKKYKDDLRKLTNENLEEILQQEESEQQGDKQNDNEELQGDACRNLLLALQRRIREQEDEIDRLFHEYIDKSR